MPDAEFKRPTEVAVDDPRVTTNQIANSSHPLFFRRFGPTCSPVEAVKMLDFDIKQYPDASRKLTYQIRQSRLLKPFSCASYS